MLRILLFLSLSLCVGGCTCKGEEFRESADPNKRMLLGTWDLVSSVEYTVIYESDGTTRKTSPVECGFDPRRYVFHGNYVRIGDPRTSACFYDGPYELDEDNRMMCADTYFGQVRVEDDTLTFTVEADVGEGRIFEVKVGTAKRVR